MQTYSFHLITIYVMKFEYLHTKLRLNYANNAIWKGQCNIWDNSTPKVCAHVASLQHRKLSVERKIYRCIQDLPLHTSIVPQWSQTYHTAS
jgi:hypothetical protein